MRCSDCNKFVALDFEEPEVENESIDEEGCVEIEVRLVRTCSECNQELKEATLYFEIEHAEACAAHRGEGHQLEVEITNVDSIEEGGGRWKKSYYGARVSYQITCSCSKTFSIEGNASDKVAASEMDEIG